MTSGTAFLVRKTLEVYHHSSVFSQEETMLRNIIQSMFYHKIQSLDFDQDLSKDEIIIVSGLAKHLNKIWSDKGSHFEFSDWMTHEKLSQTLILIPETLREYYSSLDYSSQFLEHNIIALDLMFTWV